MQEGQGNQQVALWCINLLLIFMACLKQCSIAI